MQWFQAPASAYLVVSSAVLVLWGTLFFFTCIFLKKGNRQLILWALAMLALSLQPFAHALAPASVPAACALFWLVQTAGPLLALMGLVHDRLGRRQLAGVLIAWAVATALAAAGLLAALQTDALAVWLASVFLLRGLLFAVGPAVLSWPGRSGRRIPLHVALLLDGASSAYFGISLLVSGGIAAYPPLWLLNALLLSHTMCLCVIIQEAVTARGALARLERLVGNTSQGLAFLHKSGALQQVNRRMLEILGADPALLGKQHLDAADIGLDVVLAGAREGRAEVRLDFAALAERGLPVSRSGIAHLDATVRCEGTAGQGGLFVQIEDVTERDRTLSLLMENRYRMELVMQAADAYEYVRDGRTLRAEGWFRALGHTFQSIDMLEFLDYVHPQDHAKYPIDRALEQAVPGRTFSSEGRFKNAEGNYVWFYVSSRNVVLNDKTVTVGMALNIDRHKRMEQHLMQNDRLAAVGQLANGVAHDIGNHLMTIQTSLGLLNTVQDEVQRRKYISYLQEAVANSTGMLKRLVNFSKGDEEGFSAVSMNGLLAQSKELLERAMNRNTSIDYSNSAESDQVMGNYYELQNIILNIGLNARDALPETDGRIAIKTWNGQFNALKPDRGEGWYFLSIRDNGCGMSGETQKRIFDPFFTTKPQGRGSGLGLFTSYGSVQRHRGTISVESAEGEGTEFVIALPLALQADDNNSQPAVETVS